jgi:DNA-binding NtrC family response regulator
LPSEESLLPPGLCVLLVEDEPLIALDGEAILHAMGVGEVVWVRTVADGLNALGARPFHAAFLDLRLGQDSSIPLAQRLASLNVPFGFLTGFQGDAIPEEFKDCPILIKPFTPDQLGKLLQNLLGKT